ncbi:MAG TPA: ATP synthase F1 subunit delta [Terriglobales bacterium]|jgi:F-type H+-transporting ATPase subunit delta
MAAVASRYARALVEVILENKIDADIARRQLQAIVEAVHDSDDLRRVWESPAISSEQKRAVLDGIAKQIGAVKPVRNFIAVIIDHRRIGMLADIARQFEAELDVQLGFVEVAISSARTLTPGEKRDLENRVERMTGKKVRARYSLNPELLGGVSVRVGSTIYDGSVRGQLEKMRQQLSLA